MWLALHPGVAPAARTEGWTTVSSSYARQPEPVTPAGPIVCTWDEWVQVVDVPLVQTGEGEWTFTFTSTLT